MNWFKCLFSRKPKPVPFDRPKPGPDIIGRQAGQKRNRVHIYRQPFGYPIRLCDWVMVELTDIEKVGECQGVGGPAELTTLLMALDWRANQGDRICKHCEAVAIGYRQSINAAPFEGAG